MEDSQVSSSFLDGWKQIKASFDTQEKHIFQGTV